MERTGDQSLVKQINKSIVLSSIQKHSPISRIEISKQTGLNKATVSSLVSELINEQLTKEVGAGISSGGRKPVMLYFNHTAGYSIGLDLGVNYILGVLTDLQGNIVQQREFPMANKHYESIYPLLHSLISELIKAAPKSPFGVVGVGIGVPGLVDKNGWVLFAPNLGWENVDLKAKLKKDFQIPVVIENEAKAGAYGEKIFGAGRTSRNLIYVSVGIGVGAGIIIEDKLYQGNNGFSGEVGHFSIETNGKKCRCGNIGCWELYSSEETLLNEVNAAFGKRLTLEEVIQQAEDGNDVILKIINTVGFYLGVGLVNIVNTFNPEQIVIGNRLARLENWLHHPIDKVLDQRLLSYYKKRLDITFSELGPLSSALGSSAFASNVFLTRDKVSVQ
ncbi:ROK family transcriptional regulator [Marinococcus sp. PL1-022]|uniref:ROK family transcriptional regulator n=1 Tax=Marinococcus sp. PL1-022 TaxID=3095363 RepID=UPI0029C57BC6|nr:ROK family protein [Marinococcus sp. PL1-022]MDX6152298.1 ROK family protein [Marinococcus sp. PL1-022]